MEGALKQVHYKQVRMKVMIKKYIQFDDWGEYVTFMYE